MWTLSIRPLGFFVVFLAIFGWITTQAGGQDKAKPQDPEEVLPAFPIWKTDLGVRIETDVTLLGGGFECAAGTSPWTILGRRLLLSESDFLKGGPWHFNFMEFVPPLPPAALAIIKDGRPLPNVFRKELFKDLKNPDLGWYIAFVNAVQYTADTEANRFKNSAEDADLHKYTHLKAKAPLLRGKIVPVKGKLKAIRKEEAPRHVKMQHVYTGWIITDQKGATPFVVTLTELPEGLSVSEDLNREVTFLGYFLSFVRFPNDNPAAKAKKDVDCPYFVGKIIEVAPPRVVDETGSVTYIIVMTVLGGIVAVAISIAVINVWLRRHDAKVRQQLAELRAKQSPFTVEPADETPPEEQPPAPV